LAIGQEILELGRGTKVVVLTAQDDQRTVEMALAAGFDGYLTKSISMARFASSIQAVLRGEAAFPHGSRQGRSREGGERDALLLAEQLTPRERDVLRLLVQGARGDSLAGNLGISPNTVRTHVQSILTKLQVHSRLEAATFAVRHGVVHASSQRAAS
jgi:two-component system, NarL family, nitrate/nitrite response regulator NarL